MDWQARAHPRFFGSPNIMLLLGHQEKDLTDWARESLQDILLDALKASLHLSNKAGPQFGLEGSCAVQRRRGGADALELPGGWQKPRGTSPCCKAGRARSRCSAWRSAEKQAFVVARPRQGPAFLPRFQLVGLDDTGACVCGKLHRATPCDPESRSGTEAEAIDRKSSRSISILCISCPTVPPNILPVRRKCFTSKAQHLWLLSRSVWMLTWTLVCSWRWLRPKVSPSGGFLPVHMPRLTRQLASMAPCAKLTACRRRTTRKRSKA